MTVGLHDGSARTVGEVIAATETDAWLVTHRGRIIAEGYAAGMAPASRHTLMSVSKSVVALVAGALVGQGILDPAAPVTDYVPELQESGYAGATVRDVLDMRSGVHFSEDYLDPDSEVRLLDEVFGWAPTRHPDRPGTLKGFLTTLRQARPHGGPFEYRSAETNVLGWVCERATGTGFPELAGTLLWSRLGAEYGAYICVDSEGAGLYDGGVCATAGDLARLGALVLGRGVSLTGEHVVPPWWIDDLFTASSDSAEAFATGPVDYGLPQGHYRSKFWVPVTGGDVVLGIGIHGQLLYVDRAHDLVGVKLSSWPTPLDHWRLQASLRMFETIAARLSDR